MDRRSFFRALGAVAIPATAAAQDSRISTSSGRRSDEGFTHIGNQMRASKPTIIRYIIAPEPEPTLPSDHGQAWIYFSGPADATNGQLKCNFNGNVLALTDGTWGLQ